MNRRHAADRTAFTLIELVASAVLASMMMVALMSVVWSSVRELTQLRESSASRFPVTHLVDQLRSDLQNSRGMATDRTGITLHGFLGRDPKTMKSLVVPGRVRYQIDRVNGRSVLSRSSAGGTREPVWIGIDALLIEPLSFVESEDASLPPPETGGLVEMPYRFRLTLVGTRGQPLWREVIHHHEN